MFAVSLSCCMLQLHCLVFDSFIHHFMYRSARYVIDPCSCQFLFVDHFEKAVAVLSYLVPLLCSKFKAGLTPRGHLTDGLCSVR